jgi:hypothetical protein
MPRRLVVTPLALLGIIALLVAAPTAAVGAGAGDPKVRVRSTETVVENEVATLSIEYRCATGSTATLRVTMWQGGTSADPVSLYDSAGASPADRPAIVCDGDRHLAYVTAILVGWDADATELPYEFFTITRNGGERVNVVATLTDLRTGVVDADPDRVRPIGRD